jgi:hypothetical protein
LVVPIDKDLKSVELWHILTHSETLALFCGMEQFSLVAALAEGWTSLELVVLFAAPGGRSPNHTACNADGGQTVLPLHTLQGAGTFPPVTRHPNSAPIGGRM